MKSWCQNVRNDLSYEMKLKVAIEGDRAKFDSCFSEKNVEMSATTWSKFCSEFFSISLDIFIIIINDFLSY